MTFRSLPLLLLTLSTVPAAAQDAVLLDGATGVLPLAKALAAGYHTRFPDAKLEIGLGLSTTARLEALAAGRIHLALASHGVTPDAIRSGNLTVVTVARGAIVFAVNQTVPVTDLSEQQLCELFGGSMATWRGVGGNDSAVAVLTRPAAEVDPEVIRATIPCFKELMETPGARVIARGDDMARALAETPYAVGMTSMTVVAQSGGRVRALALNGVAPTTVNIESGRYPLARNFLFVFKGEAPRALQHFLAFVRSAEGAGIIMANGAVPVR